jgi:hypothetical protein
MKNNLLLTLAALCCKAMCVLIIVGFVFLTGVLIYWHINPDANKFYIFIAAFRAYGPDTFLGYAITETWGIADTATGNPPAWANIKRFSLYFIYLQSAALMWCFFLVFKEAINIITSVKLRQSFRIGNYRSFRNIGKYFFYIFCLSGICFIASEYGNFYGFYVHLTPLILMMGAYIMAEIFKEGNVLQEEVLNTV